jgi:AraC-like DNA-binding protein
MKAHFEKVTADHSVLYAYERTEPSFAFYWHYHPDYELTLILDGHGQRLIGNSIEDYGPGDLVLIGPNLPHTYKSGPGESTSSQQRALVIQFRPERLGECFLNLPEMHFIRRLLKQSSNGLCFSPLREPLQTRVLQALQALPGKSSANGILDILQVLSILSEEGEPQMLSAGRIKPLLRVEDQQRINLICQFLCENYEQEIDYDTLSKKLHMNQASICRFFRHATGRTMTNYVNDYRISAAAQLLTQTDKSILEIAFEVGFGNYSHFNRQFQKCKGKTPRMYRATWGTRTDSNH